MVVSLVVFDSVVVVVDVVVVVGVLVGFFVMKLLLVL